MPPKDDLVEPAGDPRRPGCPALGGDCLLHRMAQAMGVNIFDALVSFVLEAETGSRLSLQRNRDEFTVQITGAVQRTVTDVIDPAFLRGLQKKLENAIGQPTAASIVEKIPRSNNSAADAPRRL